MRKRIILATVAAGALLTGCTRATTGQAIAANTPLAAKTPGDKVAMAGLDAAAYDRSGHITFWHDTDGDWQRIGASTYPLQPALGPVDATVTGARLTGMSHAVFILTGLFSMDGSVNAIAYTADTDGAWGAIKAEPGGNIGPSGQPVGSDGIGLSNGFYVVGGQLETADCASTLPMASCGGNQRILKFWTWNGTDFTLGHTAGLKH
jgi:hypothetical protein